MKRRLIAWAALALACALAMCAVAEELPLDEGAGLPAGQASGEIVELDLGAKAPGEDGDGGIGIELGGAAPQAGDDGAANDTPNDGESDFEVVNGVLVKYHGTGGDVVIPPELGVTAIGKGAFYDKPVTSVVIPDTVTTIGDSAFESCDKLTSIDIPASVTRIGDCCFFYATQLASVTLHEGLKEIGWIAFAYCSKLEDVTIPDGVTKIGSNAFAYTAIRSIRIPESVVFDDTGNSSGGFLAGCRQLTEVKLPSNLYKLPGSMFSNCVKLANVDIPESVQKIDGLVFQGCISLTKVVVPKNVTRIGGDAFKDCYGLTDVTLDCDHAKIEDSAFDGVPATATFRTHCETEATTWAREKGYNVVSSDHRKVNAPAVAPTEQQTGLTKGVVCAYCGKVYSGRKVVPKLPSSIYLDRSSATLELGSTLQLNATLWPGDSASTLKWTSSKPKVAKVSSKGKVTPLKPGTAKITVETVNGLKTTCEVKVVRPNPKSVKIKGKKTMKVGDKQTLKATIKPSYAEGKLTWSSSDAKIATVSQKGVVKAKKVGEVTITAKAVNGMTASIKINVKKK